MSTIVVISSREYWDDMQRSGVYTHSTLKSELSDIGFIHCTFPDQTLDVANRHFTDRDNVLLLLIDVNEVKPEVKVEAALSGRAGVFPHIYGPLNIDAVFGTVSLEKGADGLFLEPPRLKELIQKTP